MRFSSKIATPIAALLILSGCGTEAPSPAADHGFTTELTEKISTWWGSTADAEAGQVLASYSLNGITDSCLKKLGYSRFDWRASIFPANSDQELALGSVLGIFDSMLFADDYALSMETNYVEAFLNSPPERSEKEIAAEDACLKESRKSDVSDDELEAMRLPPAVAELRGLWRETVTDAESRVVKPVEFRACFDKKKLPEMRGRSGDELAHLADEVKREIEAEKLSPKETAAKFAEWDSAITGAFRECAEPYVGEVQEAIDGAYQQFERDHAKQIKQAQDAWASVRRDAEELGWSLDEPLAGYKRQHVK